VAEDNVIEHKNGILANPVPGKVEVTGFRRVENGLNTFDISIAVPTPDAVQSSLNLR
jgi:hypothetical protein